MEGWRQQGVRISSGFLVDGEGKPGGGGLLLLEAVDFVSAEALIRQDPMLLSGDVRRSLPHKARSCPQASPTSASTAATSPSLR